MLPSSTSTRTTLPFSNITPKPGGASGITAHVHGSSVFGAAKPPPSAAAASGTVIPARRGPIPNSVIVIRENRDVSGARGAAGSLDCGGSGVTPKGVCSRSVGVALLSIDWFDVTMTARSADWSGFAEQAISPHQIPNMKQTDYRMPDGFI